MIDAFDLIAGSPAVIDGITICQPTLEDIKRVGHNTYERYLGTLLLTKQTFLESCNLDDAAALPFQTLTMLDIYCFLKELREPFLEALSFFIDGGVRFDEQSMTLTSPDGIITNDNYEDIRQTIFEAACMKGTKEEKPPSFASQKARDIYEKIQKGRREAKISAAKSKDAAKMSLPNVISAVCAIHPSINLTNVWGLTVFQLYDQLTRIATKSQLDVYGFRWAAWGKDTFDCTLWLNDISDKGENKI